MSLSLPDSGFVPTLESAGRALRYIASRFPLQRQDIADDAIGSAQIDGTWTTWTPTWTNLTVGDGTVTAQYLNLGGMAFFNLEFVFGTTSAIAGDVSASPPITQAAVGTTPAILGVGQILDAGTATFQAVARNSSTTAINIRSLNQSGASLTTATALSSTAPMTWATGDAFHLHGWIKIT